MEKFSFLNFFKLNRREESRDKAIKRIENILVVEKLESKGRELLLEIKKIEKKNMRQVGSSVNNLITKNELLLDKAQDISEALKKLEIKIANKSFEK